MVGSCRAWLIMILIGAGTAFVAVSITGKTQVALAAGPSVHITVPSGGFKLRQGRTMAVRARVQPGDHPLAGWALRLQGPQNNATELASGAKGVDDGPVAQVKADALAPGEPDTLVLEAADTAGMTASDRVSFLIPDPQYTLVPLDSGNNSRPTWSGLSMDSSGNVVAMGGNQFGDVQVVHAAENDFATIHLNLASSDAIRLSGDGQRLIFDGGFPGTVFSALGIFVLDTQAITEGPVGNPSSLISTDRTGRWIAFQSGFDLDPGVGNPGGALQYFLYDAATTEVRQLTSDPKAIDYSGPCSTDPVISGDGTTVAFATTATLGLAPADPNVGCRIFAYDVLARTLRHVIPLGADSEMGGAPHISNDGRWFSFSLTRTVPPGIRLALPALLDVRSGDLTDPLGGITDFPSFDSVVTGDGSVVVVSTEADLDPRVGNADHNMELFVYDPTTRQFTQITETTGGISPYSASGTCSGYNPPVSVDGSIVAFWFIGVQMDQCIVTVPQRSEIDGFVFNRVRAVRKRPGNHAPILQYVGHTRVQAGETVSLNFSATDPDDDAVVFFAQLEGGTDVPLGSTIEDHHDGTAAFTWPTRPEDTGSYPLRVAAFDEGGGETVQDIALAVCSRIVTDGTLPGLLDSLFESEPPAVCRDADFNQDGAISAADVVKAAQEAAGGS